MKGIPCLNRINKDDDGLTCYLAMQGRLANCKGEGHCHLQ